MDLLWDDLFNVTLLFLTLVLSFQKFQRVSEFSKTWLQVSSFCMFGFQETSSQQYAALTNYHHSSTQHSQTIITAVRSTHKLSSQQYAALTNYHHSSTQHSQTIITAVRSTHKLSSQQYAALTNYHHCSTQHSQTIITAVRSTHKLSSLLARFP